MRNSSQLSTFSAMENYNIPPTMAITHNDDTSSNFHKRNLITFYFDEVQFEMSQSAQYIGRMNGFLCSEIDQVFLLFRLDQCVTVCVAADDSGFWNTGLIYV